MQNKKVTAAMQCYTASEKLLPWANKHKEFSEKEANAFFVGVLLDQMQYANRAWNGGEHLVDNYFKQGNFWRKIAKTNLHAIKKIGRKGFDGDSYALGVKANSFPRALKFAAEKMCDKYDSDPRNIWNVPPQELHLIYKRFKEFKQIGDALAKMAQFILVRKYGIADGKQTKGKLSVKPDIHVRRVSYRLGLITTPKTNVATKELDQLKINSPADFDWAMFNVGRKFCRPTKPNCTECCLLKACAQVGL